MATSKEVLGPTNSLRPGRPLDQDQLDSLRLDCQDQSPQEINYLRQLTAITHDALLQYYGKYIPCPKTHQEIFDRFIFAHPPVYRAFFDHWISSKITKTTTTHLEPGSKGLMRAFDVPEGHLVIGYIPDVWKELDEAKKIELTRSSGGIKKAKHFVYSLEAVFQIAHETVHLYQDHQALPLWFLECAAYFYTDKIIAKKKWASLKIPSCELPIKFYDFLITKHGAAVHQLCFGSPVTRKKTKKILSEMTPGIQALIFPTMRTEKK
ncbi:MAG: hypothetical protein WAV56_02625 [Microgenomates group bacterium]